MHVCITVSQSVTKCGLTLQETVKTTNYYWSVKYGLKGFSCLL